jgi:UDPglucose 6-dehydrogenase
MFISIIGVGVVGSALKKLFSRDAKNVIFSLDLHNLSKKKKIELSDIIYVCLPTNLKKNKLDTKLIEKYLFYLNKKKFKNIIVIKSTLNPGDTEKFKKKYKFLKKIVFCPEFLRERSAYKDLINQKNLIIGTESKSSAKIIIKNHEKCAISKITICKSTEAEMIKLFSNAYNACRIVFAISFAKSLKSLSGISIKYDSILKNYLNLGFSSGKYLKASNKIQGFSGKCLPKDLQTLNNFSKKMKIKFFQNIIDENNKFKKTIIKK